jgi:hypothetical protein
MKTFTSVKEAIARSPFCRQRWGSSLKYETNTEAVQLNIILTMHEDYFETAYCRTKIPTILRGILGIFHDISICLFIYFSTIYRRTSNDLLRNPGWETLIQTDSTNGRKIRLIIVNSKNLRYSLCICKRLRQRSKMCIWRYYCLDTSKTLRIR